MCCPESNNLYSLFVTVSQRTVLRWSEVTIRQDRSIRSMESTSKLSSVLKTKMRQRRVRRGNGLQTWSAGPSKSFQPLEWYRRGKLSQRLLTTSRHKNHKHPFSHSDRYSVYSGVTMGFSHSLPGWTEEWYAFVRFLKRKLPALTCTMVSSVKHSDSSFFLCRRKLSTFWVYICLQKLFPEKMGKLLILMGSWHPYFTCSRYVPQYHYII